MVGYNTRLGSNFRQAESSLLLSKKELKKQFFHSRAESIVLQDRQSLNNTSINNQFNTSYLQGKNLSKAQNTPIKHDYRIRTSYTKQRNKLKTPSIHKQIENRTSLNEFKIPFHIYQDLTQVNSPAHQNINNTFTSKSLLKSSRIQLKRGNSQNDMRFTSITKNKQSPRHKDKSKSRERSIKSSMSNRSYNTKLQSISLKNKTQIQDQLHQPQLRKLRIEALKEFSKGSQNGNQADRFDNQYMKIIEEQSQSNYQNHNSRKVKNQGQQQKSKQVKGLEVKILNVNTLMNNQKFHPQTVKNQNTQQNQSNLTYQRNKMQNIIHPSHLEHNIVKSTSPRDDNNIQNANSLAHQNNNNQTHHQHPISYKKLLEEVNTENVFLRQQMHQMLDEQTKKQSQINKMKVKTAQAQSDKIELMRDLATYESNFADNCGVRSILLQLHKKIQNVRQQIQCQNRNNTQESIDGKGETWLDNKQKSTIFEHLSELSILKRERGSVSEGMNTDIFLSNTNQQSPIKNVNGLQNQMFFNKHKKNPITPRDELKGNFEDQLFISTQISGISSTIQANLLNGIVQVIVQTNIDHKQHKIDIKPLNTKVKISLQREVKRLYFCLENFTKKTLNSQFAQMPWTDRGKNQNTKSEGFGQKLVLIASDSYEEDLSLRQVVKIQGSKFAMQEAQIQKQQATQDNKENHEVNIQVKDKDQYHIVQIKSEQLLSNYQAFKILETQYTFREIKNNQQELINICECTDQHIQKNKWLRKIRQNQQLSEKTLNLQEENILKQEIAQSPKNNSKQQSSVNQSKSKYQSLQQQSVSNSSSSLILKDNQNQQNIDINSDRLQNTPGRRNNQYMSNINQSPDFSAKVQQAIDEFDLEEKEKKQSAKLINILNHNDDNAFENSVSDHDNDNVVFSPTNIQEQKQIHINNALNLDDTLQDDGNQNGITELNQELQEMNQQFKRIKSQGMLDPNQEQDYNQLANLNIKAIKSQSNNNLNLNFLSMQDSKRKEKSSKRTYSNNKGSLTQEEQQLHFYEFLYHYKWYENNRQYYLIAKARQEEIERLRRLEELEKERIRQEQENEHDELQLGIILTQLEKYRDYFKGSQSIAFMKQPLMYQDEFDMDEKAKVSIFVYPIIYEDQTQDLHFLINKTTVDEKETRRDSRRSSAMRASSLDSIIINKRLLDNLGLLKFKSVEAVQEKLPDFIQSQAFKEIVKHHLAQCVIEKQLLSKTFEQQQPMSQLQVNPVILRKMESEMKYTTNNSITARGYEKTSSEFGDTSINESYYLK